MPLLPSRNSFHQPASAVLAELKRGAKEKRNEFIYLHQERFYAIGLLASGTPENATEIAISAFSNALNDAMKQPVPKNSDQSIWDWLSKFVVQACGEYHATYSDAPIESNSDPMQDGSSNMDWETTVLLGIQRVKRCLSTLPEDQQKVFLLRHHLDLNYDQIAIVLNQSPDTVMASLFRARVQIVKCLGRG